MGPEVVNGLSGGGFSDVFPAAPYQKAAINAYLTKMAYAPFFHLPIPPSIYNNLPFLMSALSNKLPPEHLWNRTGRGFPDVSALSNNYIVVCNLFPMPGVAGTSCATPVTAGIVALLNEVRLNKGKTPLGFLNPLLYALGAQANAVRLLSFLLSLLWIRRRCLIDERPFMFLPFGWSS